MYTHGSYYHQMLNKEDFTTKKILILPETSDQLIVD